MGSLVTVSHMCKDQLDAHLALCTPLLVSMHQGGGHAWHAA